MPTFGLLKLRRDAVLTSADSRGDHVALMQPSHPGEVFMKDEEWTFWPCAHHSKAV